MTAPITEENHAALWLFFSTQESGGAPDLSDSVQQILLDVLPDSYQVGCEDMIEHWGSGEDNTPGSIIRTVYIHKSDEAGPIHVLLAYRCFSYREYYRETYFDERLMALTIAQDKSVLRLLPHRWSCQPILALSKIGAAQVYQLGDAPLISLEISISSENPCCDGGFHCREELTGYYLFRSDGARQVASIKKHGEERHESIDSNGEFVTSEISYDAIVTHGENAEGDLSEIVSVYSITQNGEVMEEGSVKFVWNVQTRMFEEVME